MPHPDEGLIHAWLDGELDSTDAARVQDLVARDPEWAAAAAEARGLIAASSRIAGALDRVPGNVIPHTRPKPRTPRWWMTRAAALLLVAVGVATVVRRPPQQSGREDVTPAAAALNAAVAAQKSSAPAASSAAATTPVGVAEPQPAIGAHGTVASATGPKPSVVPPTPALVDAHARPDKDQSKNAEELKGSLQKESAMGAAGARRAEERNQLDVAREKLPSDDKAKGAAAAAAAPATAGMAKAEKDQTVVLARALAARPAAQNAAKAAAPQPRCFESRQPTDSTKRILRFSAAALADSARLGTLLERSDSLFDGSRRLVALSIRCPEP
jgi:hypothetical protein